MKIDFEDLRSDFDYRELQLTNHEEIHHDKDLHSISIRINYHYHLISLHRPNISNQLKFRLLQLDFLKI